MIDAKKEVIVDETDQVCQAHIFEEHEEHNSRHRRVVRTNGDRHIRPHIHCVNCCRWNQLKDS